MTDVLKWEVWMMWVEWCVWVMYVWEWWLWVSDVMCVSDVSDVCEWSVMWMMCECVWWGDKSERSRGAGWQNCHAFDSTKKGMGSLHPLKYFFPHFFHTLFKKWIFYKKIIEKFSDLLLPNSIITIFSKLRQKIIAFLRTLPKGTIFTVANFTLPNKCMDLCIYFFEWVWT